MLVEINSKMKRIALISLFHSEATICLAKYLAKQGTYVDCFFIIDYLRDKGYLSGFDYHLASKKLGVHFLADSDIPELFAWKDTNNVNFYLLRLFSFSGKFWWLNKVILRNGLKQIKHKHYDAINIIGQWEFLKFVHDQLLNENLIHSLHEVGSHQNNILSTSYIDELIEDKSKVILHSDNLRNRFVNIKDANKCEVTVIPFGKFETIKLYTSQISMNLKMSHTANITFLFYGYLKPYKGLSLLRRAVDKLSELSNNFNLIIAGAGDDDNLEYFKNLKNTIVINRFLSNGEIAYLNKISDVVLLPYKTASQSGIIPTSFMYGNPIIATKIGGLMEYITDGKNGLLVNADDDVAFSNAMRKVVLNTDLLNSLKTGALCFGENDQYDWNNIAKKTLAFYFK